MQKYSAVEIIGQLRSKVLARSESLEGVGSFSHLWFGWLFWMVLSSLTLETNYGLQVFCHMKSLVFHRESNQEKHSKK